MRLVFRPADPSDVPALVEIYDRAYQGGYSACFDRYGPATPQDFWWVQSEKSVSVIEVNRKPAGLILIGRAGGHLLAEEILVEDMAGGSDESARRRVHEFLVAQFQGERQSVLTMRCAETNAFVLAIAQQYRFVFANVLLVAVGGSMSARRGDTPPPSDYSLRRGTQADARNLARLHEETLNTPVRSRDLHGLFEQPDARVFLAEREKYLVGFAVAQVQDGVGRWTLGVRDAHRRKGIGRALTREALRFFEAKRAAPMSAYWGLDPAAAQFMRALGAKTERAYLYFERGL